MCRKSNAVTSNELKDNVKTHKRTKQRLLLKRSNSLVSTLYVLDDNDKKILDKNDKGKQLYDVKGNKRYKMAICLNENLI